MFRQKRLHQRGTSMVIFVWKEDFFLEIQNSSNEKYFFKFKKKKKKRKENKKENIKKKEEKKKQNLNFIDNQVELNP